MRSTGESERSPPREGLGSRSSERMVRVDRLGGLGNSSLVDAGSIKLLLYLFAFPLLEISLFLILSVASCFYRQLFSCYFYTVTTKENVADIVGTRQYTR